MPIGEMTMPQFLMELFKYLLIVVVALIVAFDVLLPLLVRLACLPATLFRNYLQRRSDIYWERLQRDYEE